MLGATLLLLGATAATAGVPLPGDVLSVGTFNVWHTDDDDVRWASTLAAVRAMRADVIGFQELNVRLDARLASLRALGYHVRDLGGGRVVASRHPIGAGSPGGLGVRVERPADAGGPLWLFDAHLRSEPYGPYMIADIPYGGWPGDLDPDDARTVQRVVRLMEQTRGRQVDALLADVRAVRGADDPPHPAILVGDFNEPSHLDWTPAAVAAGRVPVAVAWPASERLAEVGWTDAFRAVHPDPVEHPATTWSPVYPVTNPDHGVPEPQDRIDRVYVTSGLEPVAARLVGLAGDATDDDVEVAGFPSDHRAVVVTVRARRRAAPADAPGAAAVRPAPAPVSAHRAPADRSTPPAR